MEIKTNGGERESVGEKEDGGCTVSRVMSDAGRKLRVWSQFASLVAEGE